VVLAGIALFVAGIARTASAGGLGPVEPLGSMKSAISVEYNGILDKTLKKSGDMSKGRVENSNQVYAQYALGVGDMANIYGKLGTADLETKYTWTTGGRSQTVKYDYGLLWGIGGNFLYDLGNKFGIGGDAQMDMWFNESNSVTGDNSPVFTNKGRSNSYDIQASAYLTYTMEMGTSMKLVPYAGGYYSFFRTKNTDVKYADNTYSYQLGDTDGKDKFGILAGANMNCGQSVTLNLEGRFIAETALTAGLSYKF